MLKRVVVFIILFFIFHGTGFCASPEKTFALIVRGEFEERFENDEILAFNTLLSLGIPQSHIYVVSPFFISKKRSDYNNDGVKDVNYPVSLENVEKAIQEIGKNIPPDGQFLIYLCSHGSRSGFLGLSGKDSYIVLNTGTRLNQFPEYLYGEDLDKFVSHNISSEVEVVLIVQACRSGGFSNTFLKPNRIVITAAAINNSSHGCYIDNKQWSRFSYSFFKALQENLRNFLEMYETAKTNGNNIPPSTLEEITFGYQDTPEIHFGSENMKHSTLGDS